MQSESVGRRVVVRYRVGGLGPSGGPAMTDVVGRVRATDDETVTIEDRRGREVIVPRSQIVTSKVIPDRPLRTRRAADITAEQLMLVTSRGWPAIESEALGAWELRSSGGFTGRANSVAAAGDPGLPFDDALQRVIAFYRERGQRPLAQVVDGTPEAQAFAAAGWQRLPSSRSGAVVQVADLSQAATDPEVTFEASASDDWLALYGRVDDPATARSVLEGPSTVAFASIGSPPVAIGRVVVTGEWAGIAAVEVVESARRQGLARRIVTSSLAWAVDHGADKAYLQTMQDNVAALALYAPFGFADHHTYSYLTTD